MNRLMRNDQGQSAVELAITLPVLLLLLIGIVDVGLSINSYASVVNASRDGSTYAIVHPTAEDTAIAAEAARRIAPLPTTSPLICGATPAPGAPRGVCVTVQYVPRGGATFAPWPVGGLGTAAPSPTAIPIRVDVCYPWSASTILIGQFFHGGNAACSGGQSSDVFFHGTSTMVTTW